MTDAPTGATALDRRHFTSEGLPKRGYTKRGAKNAAIAIKTHGCPSPNVYRCPVCGRWHVGTPRGGAGTP